MHAESRHDGQFLLTLVENSFCLAKISDACTNSGRNTANLKEISFKISFNSFLYLYNQTTKQNFLFSIYICNIGKNRFKTSTFEYIL